MDTKRYCVYNQTTGNFLSVGATVVDTMLKPLTAQQMMVDVENLSTESSFWLVPFKAVPVARIVSPFDMVILDEDLRVIEGIEVSPAVESTPFEGGAASALVLPLHTIYSSRTYPGDQLIICLAEDLVRQLARVTNSTAPTPISRNGISPGDPPHNHNGRAPSREGDGTGRQPTTGQTQIAKEKFEPPLTEETGKVELRAEEIDAVISQVRRWAGETDRPSTHNPISAAPFRPSKEPLPDRDSPLTESHASIGLPPPVSIDRPKKKQVVSHALDESEKFEILTPDTRAGVEVHPHDIQAVVAQVLRWAEETGRPVARAPMSTTPTSVPQINAQPAEDSGSKSDIAQSSPEERSEREQGAMQQSTSMEPRRDSWMTRFLRWSDELTRPLMRPQTAARNSQGKGFTTGDTGGHRSTEHLSSPDQAQASHGKSSTKVRRRAPVRHFEALKTRFVRWLDADTLAASVLRSSERRRSKRHPLPGLVAYYWTGGTPQAHKIGDISTTGFYLLTDERWVPETMIRMTLQRPSVKGENPEEAISVISKVVRWGPDGVGYEFVLTDALELSVGKPGRAKAKSFH